MPPKPLFLPTEIVLFHPEIPHNTGAIARSCAANNTPLHLIEPLGFSLADRWLKRAGLDYWHAVDMKIWPDLESLFSERTEAGVWWITRHGKIRYDQADYKPGDLLIFGSETKGLPGEILERELSREPNRTVRLPMPGKAVRSLNLANVATVLLYESRRRAGLLERF